MRRAPFISLLIIIFLSCVLNFFALRKGHGWGDDFALYIAQARSLVEGGVETLLEQNTFAMSHSTYAIGPDLYPWGFPIILSPVYAMFGLSLLPMKLTGIFFFTCSLMILFFMFRGKLDNILLLLLVSFFAFNPFFLLLNDHINADMPFSFFSLLSIIIIDKILFKSNKSKYRWIDFLLIGFLIFLSYSIKTTGFILLPLLFAVRIMSVIKLKKTDFIRCITDEKLFLLSLGVFALSESVMRLLLPSGTGSYLSHLSAINIKLIKNNIIYYISLPSEFFGPYFSSIIYGATIPFFVLGVNRMFKVNYLYLIYPIFLLALLVSLPFVQGLRYIIPIFPFFMYFFCVGLMNSYSRLSLSIARLSFGIRTSYIFLSVIVLSLIYHSSRIAYSNFNNQEIIDGPFTESSREMFSFISAHTDNEDIIVFFKPRVLTLLTGRQAVMISDVTQLKRKAGDYLVIRRSRGVYDPIADYDQISPYSEEFSHVAEELPIIFENAGFIIFQLKRPTEAD